MLKKANLFRGFQARTHPEGDKCCTKNRRKPGCRTHSLPSNLADKEKSVLVRTFKKWLPEGLNSEFSIHCLVKICLNTGTKPAKTFLEERSMKKSDNKPHEFSLVVYEDSN